jgi:hypothetical protein
MASTGVGFLERHILYNIAESDSRIERKRNCPARSFQRRVLLKPWGISGVPFSTKPSDKAIAVPYLIAVYAI